jgi:uncharacterized protein YecE (DUF72 family)
VSAPEATVSRRWLGTSSWSEKAWVGPFYPRGTKPGDFLNFYATAFDTVEVDATYYRVPTQALVRGWEQKTPAGFRLSAKFPRSIVHGGASEKPDASRVLVPAAVAEDTERFLEAMALMGGKLGPLVLQFPYFNRETFAGLEPFLERLEPYLASLPRTFRYAVEVRNKHWLTPALCAVLRRHDAALVLVDILYMPHPADLARELDLVTTDFTYARLIGDRKAVEAATESFDRVVIDQEARLERWARLLRELSPRVRETFAYANNHYAGFAPDTIRELARKLAD